MAIETLDFLVSPNDDWTLVATNPDYLFIQPSMANPWRLAVTASGAPADPTSATGTITFTGTGSAADTVTIDGETFTFVVGAPASPDEVEIGGSATVSRDNLLAAIAAVITPGLTINATASGADAITLTAVVPGVAGNSFVLTASSTDFSVTGSGTLLSGSDGTGSVVFKPEEYGGRGYAYESFAPITGEFYIKADRPRALLGQNVQFGVIRDNGTGSSGGGTSPSRVLVEPLGQPSVARQLPAGAASANTVLTATVRRISMRAITADIRYAIGATAQTADGNTSHFIAQNERLDVAVPLGANIAIIRDASTDGTLELSELV